MVENCIFHCLVQKENKRDKKYGEKFSLQAHLFLSSQFERKMGRKKCWMIYFIQIPPLYSSYLPPTLCNKGIIINLYKLHFLSSHFFFQPNKRVFITTYPWCYDHSTSISVCRVCGANVEVQVSKREFHTHTLRLD